MKLLPGDSKHPPRPDLPIIRHFTYREGHLMELGLYLGFTAAVTWTVDSRAAALAILVEARRRMQKNPAEKTRPDTITGWTRDAWYLGLPLVVSFLVTVLLVRWF